VPDEADCARPVIYGYLLAVGDLLQEVDLMEWTWRWTTDADNNASWHA